MKTYLFSIQNLTIIILTIVLVFCSTGYSTQDKDSTEILAQVNEYQNIWNTHNAAALVLFFTEDADFIMGNMPLVIGRKGIQNWWQNYFNRQKPGRRLTIHVNSLRIIAPDVALINLETTTGRKDNQDKELTKRKARGTWVLHQQNGNWLIVAMRGMPTEGDQIIRNIEKPAFESEGTFAPAGPPLEIPVRNEIGEGCIVGIKQPYNITGTLTGKFEIDYRILVHGSCDKSPGTFNEEWIAFGSFNGTVDGMPKSGKFTYTADVKAGQGIDGELIVKGNFKDGKLSYNGHLN
jgi:uncharacterized protein (TIGR02246 family)